jgi:hypothetical protein
MATPPYSLVPTPLKRGWLESNPRWKIPLGLLIIVVLVGGFTTGLMTIVFASFQNSDVYKQSIAQAEANPQVQQLLGEPLKPGWLITGQLNVNGSSGIANFSIPVSGPKGKGAIRVVASKNAGVWRFTYLQVSVEGERGSIDLLAIQPLQ